MRNLMTIILVTSLISIAYTDDIKISCIGNSITSYKGQYPNVDLSSYPIQLGILMGDGYDIQNFGVHSLTVLKNGDVSVWDEIAFYDGLAFEPDIVTVLLGTNDSKPQNWVYKDEFVGDYRALIDTIRSLPSNPDIYTCFPPPAFSSKYDINDSIIVNDIIPRIQQVADEKNTTIIDFYSHFIDKSHLSYDGIHPTIDGLWEYAKVIHTTLTQNSIEEIVEVNLALNQTVLTPISSSIPDHLVDGNIKTNWIGGENATVTVDLGAIESIGMFQILLSTPAHFGYIIETSENNVNWTVAVDASDNPDIIQVARDSIESVNAQWIRYTFGPAEQPIQIAELRILKTAPVYAPLITYMIDKVHSKYVRFDLTITSSIKGGYIKYITADSANGIFTGGLGYRMKDETVITVTLNYDKERYYITKFYKDGYEAVSDTLKIDYSITSMKEKPSLLPNQFTLHQNYPNPFNPLTTIHYHLQTSGQVKLTVYDCLGRELNNLVDQFQKKGDHSVQFQSKNLSSGLYFYSLETNGSKIIKKMVLLK